MLKRRPGEERRGANKAYFSPRWEPDGFVFKLHGMEHPDNDGTHSAAPHCLRPRSPFSRVHRKQGTASPCWQSCLQGNHNKGGGGGGGGDKSARHHFSPPFKQGKCGIFSARCSRTLETTSYPQQKKETRSQHYKVHPTQAPQTPTPSIVHG